MTRTGFWMGGVWWSVRIVPPSSPCLVDRTGNITVATTEPRRHRINVSSALTGGKLETVLAHEMTHAAMRTYGLEGLIRRKVPSRHRFEIEEAICNLVADHGADILENAELVSSILQRVGIAA